jgi:hypothetical protein
MPRSFSIKPIRNLFTIPANAGIQVNTGHYSFFILDPVFQRDGYCLFETIRSTFQRVYRLSLFAGFHSNFTVSPAPFTMQTTSFIA